GTEQYNAAATAPIAALYVSPAWPAEDDAQQQHLMVNGDFLSAVGANGNEIPTGTQVESGPIDRHDLRRYLEPGTRTQADITTKYRILEQHVLGVPDPNKPCRTSSTLG